MSGILALLPIIMSGIQALLRYRQRIDDILSVKATTEGLPFKLPPLVDDVNDSIDAALDYFAVAREAVSAPEYAKRQLLLGDVTPTVGLETLKLHRRTTGLSGEELALCQRLAERYLAAEQLNYTTHLLLPPASGGGGAWVASEMQLAYYIVDSARASNNPAIARILLATADTLLEFVGENASLFVSDPKTCGIVETFVTEFANKHDFDDAGATEIFKLLLGSAAVTAITHKADLPQSYPVQALIGALGDLRSTEGSDFVAKFVTADNFEKLLSNFATRMADSPALTKNRTILKDLASSAIRTVGKELPCGFDADSAHRIIEAVIVTAAEDAGRQKRIIDNQLGDNILRSFIAAVGEQAKQDRLVDSLKSKELLGDVYEAVLRGIAQNPVVVKDATERGKFINSWIAAVATILSTTPLQNTLTPETIEKLVGASLRAAAKYPSVIAGKDAFAAALVGAALEAAAPLVEDGLSERDALDIVNVVLAAVAENQLLLKMPDQLKVVIGAAAGALSQQDVKSVLSAAGRKTALIEFLKTLAANPVSWSKMAQQDAAILKPLVDGIITGLAGPAQDFMSGPHVISAIGGAFNAALPYAQVFIDETINDAALKSVLDQAMKAAAAAALTGLSNEKVPAVIARVVDTFLDAVLKAAGVGLTAAQITKLIDDAIKFVRGI